MVNLKSRLVQSFPFIVCCIIVYFLFQNYNHFSIKSPLFFTYDTLEDEETDYILQTRITNIHSFVSSNLQNIISKFPIPDSHNEKDLQNIFYRVRDELQQKKQELYDNMDKLHLYRGSGIVFTMPPDDNHLRKILINVRHLRKHQCLLEIEIHYESAVWYPPQCFSKIIHKYGVRLRPIPESLVAFAQGNRFFWKPFSLLLSSFQRVLFIDVDNIPTKDVTFLFSELEKRDVSAIFWPDLWLIHDGPLWQAIGKPWTPKGNCLETGQLLTKKDLFGVSSLLIACFLNYHYHKTYSHIYYINGGNQRRNIGDADTFLLGWYLMNATYHIMSPPKFLVSGDCFMSQLPVFDDKVVFCHHNSMKFFSVNEIQKLFNRTDLKCAFIDDARHGKSVGFSPYPQDEIEVVGSCHKLRTITEIDCGEIVWGKQIQDQFGPTNFLKNIIHTASLIEQEGDRNCLS